MIDRMYQLDDFSADQSAGISRRDWVCARGFELVHSSRVPGFEQPERIRAAGESSARAAEPAGVHEYLVSVLREEWPEGREQCRLRVMHSAPGVGSLTAVVTGPPVPLVLRLERGDSSPAQRLFPVRIDLEIRRGGQAPGAMSLPKFPLQAGSSYTIVIAAATASAPDLLEWTEEYDHAE